MENMEWPLVAINDDGIRPAGPQDECFYCQQKVGSEHKRDCVIVEKLVKIRISFEIDVEVPHHWNKDNIEFRYNDSSWCADNTLDMLQAEAKKQGCLCSVSKVEYLKITNDTPRRKLTGEKSHE